MVVPPAGAAIPARSSPAPVTANGTPVAKGKSASQSAPGTLNGPPSGNNHAIPLSARRAEPLDMSKVERRGQPNQTPDVPRKPRPNGIPDAPIFRPTEEEFKDPMEYMRKIQAEGRKYGVVKIVPPENWNPPFAINTERFHFRTRRQELNSVEGGNRVNNDYLDLLAKFHKTHGHSLNRFPSVDKRPLDLYRLKKTVERKGGFDAVCKGKRWAEVGRDLGYSGKIMSSLSTSLKNSYQKWLLPYEEYLRLAKPGVQHHMEMMNGGPFTPSPGPSPAKKSQMNTPVGVKEETPAMRASSTLNATLNGHTPAPTIENQLPPAAPTGGFTPVNPGGFTAVNATNSFASVNGSVASTNDNPPQSQTPQPTGNVSTASDSNGPSLLKRQYSDSVLSQSEMDALDRRSKRLRRDTPTIPGSSMHHARIGVSRVSNKDRVNWKPGEVCEGCGKPGDTAKQIICESCDCAWHMYCLDQPLKQRPEFEWHCPRCLVGTNEYGFEEGDVYSLSAFQRRAEEFKTNHFASLPRQHNPLNEFKHTPTEEDVEREFWRLVDDINDTVEVEYGADIHSTTHGSGFPTIEKQPRDTYSTDPWNLNILPLDKESLFRHIKSDISGMTVPWLYVGMVFSTFCWHNEDHFSYSANYQHFGGTKTWYGIPGEDSYAFETAMRDEVPELFEMQPDLLFQLVTLAKPEKLRKAGVHVYAVDQHAGEFVITYPRAYHAGFNHGFNFNEAVNFAPSDWEPFGEEGVRRLRDYRKQPCFSHDELLLTAAAGNYNIRTAKWLATALERLRENETNARLYFLTGEPNGTGLESSHTGPRYEGEPHIIQAADEIEDEEFTCMFCKAYCYLSRLVCTKTGKSVCLLHAGSFECCDASEVERFTGSNNDHVLCYRMHNDSLEGIVRKAADKACVPETWAQKVEAELLDTSTPSLRHLRTLLAEGEKIQYDLPQLPDLKRFVDRCNEWVEEATNYITRKQQNRRKNEKAWRKSTTKTEFEERDKELRNVDNIRKLLDSADQISFDCPEITTLRERADSIDEFRRDADEALHSVQSKTVQEFEELVDRGKEFHVDIPEIDQLETLLKRLKWNEMAVLKRPTNENPRQDLTLSDISNFISEGIEIGVPEDNSDLVYFKEQRAHGEMWEQKAQELMSVEHVHFQQLDALSRQATTLPVSAETLARIDAILKKQREVQEKIISLYEQTKDPDFRKRPMYREVRDVIASLDELQSKPTGTIDLEKEQKRHEDWMRRGKKLFGKANAPLHILHQHMQIVEQRNEACFDLRDKPRMPVEPSSRANTPDEHGDKLHEGGSSSRDVFCICRRPEAGMMIECELCHEWYHGKCLKIARGKVKEDDKYTCPICDWRVKIPRDAARPKLDDLQAWQDELENLPFQPEEEETLNNIVTHGQAFRDFLRPYCQPWSVASPEEVGTFRFHLRKIEGADILLAWETNLLRQQLHKWAPVAPMPPPQIEASASTRKPRPTKLQKTMAMLGITNPDDLPQQYKIKPHIAKRKASETMGKNVPLQPAGQESVSPAPQGSQPLAAPFGAPKLGLTALAIQVLGSLAGNPVALKMLAAEPHMNREKLEKMRVLLSANPDLSDDVQTFTAKMQTLPHMPAFGYENHNQSQKATPSATPFRDQSMFSNGSSHSPVPQQARLVSPANFNSSQPHINSASPVSPQLGNMFDTSAGGRSIFDSPAGQDAKPQLTNADFEGNPRTLFSGTREAADAEEMAQLALQHDAIADNSQGNSQGNNMDNVFADLVNDHDATGDATERSSAPTEQQPPAMAKVEDMDTTMVDVAHAAPPAQQAVIDPALESSI